MLMQIVFANLESLLSKDTRVTTDEQQSFSRQRSVIDEAHFFDHS